MKTIFYILALIPLFLTRCLFDDDEPKVTNEPPELRELELAELDLIESSNEFAFDLIREVNEVEHNNFFISPLSVGYALGMTSNGAKGTTKEGIKIALDVDEMSDEEVNEAYKTLTSLLLNMDGKVDLSIANSIWYRNDLTIKQAFEQIMIEYYDAVVTSLDFAAPEAKEIINGWIEEKTNDLIKDMIDQIPPDAVMYLVNAIYFKADWKFEFDPELTVKAPFYLEDGTSIDVDMMTSTGSTVSQYLSPGIQFVEIPYGNGQFVMDIILPADDSTLDEMLEELSMSALNTMVENADTGTVELHFPKFKFAFKSLLNDYLINMGMETAFSDSADFSELFEVSGPLQISRVIHQSTIEVNEEGSEAAAATVVEIIETSAGGGAQSIWIDQPFLFLIREKHTNSILFAGKMMNPNG